MLGIRLNVLELDIGKSGRAQKLQFFRSQLVFWTAGVENLGRCFPLFLSFYHEGNRHPRLYPKDILRVSGESAKVVAGGVLNNAFTDLVSYKKFRPEVQLLFVPGFGKTEYQFLVQGKGDITVRYESRHGGTLEKKVKLES